MNGLVVIVDAYGPARMIPPYLKSKGLVCAHVQSTPQPLPRFALPIGADFETALVHAGDVRATAGAIEAFAKAKGLALRGLIAGIEAGVDLADELSERLRLPSNGTALGRVRRDKYAMSERLKEVGLRGIHQCRSGEPDELVEWARRECGFPLVIKPVDSAGGDGVYVCNDEAELRGAAAKVLNATNLMGRINREVIAQELLRGTEYVVNSASCEGKHHTTDIWRSAKTYLAGRGFIYDREELMPPDVHPQTEVIAYVHSVLDALGIRFGPSHAEVMLTERGPVLIEVGARMSGSLSPSLVDRCMGQNHMTLGMDGFVDPERFKQRTAAPSKLREHALLLVLSWRSAGIAESVDFLDAIRALPTFYGTTASLNPGDEVRRTEDLKSALGFLYMVSEVKSKLFEDYESARKIMDAASSELAALPQASEA